MRVLSADVFIFGGDFFSVRLLSDVLMTLYVK